MKERALAVGIFNSGTAIGAALATPVVSAIALAWGWRPAFVITGALGFIWVAIWLVVYRLPQHHERITDAERDLILSGSSIAAEQGESVPIMRLLRMRETWGCVMARFLTDPISYFLFFWIPKYLQQERGFSLADLGKYAWMPYAALALGNIASGAIPRWLIARGWTLSRARKTTMLADSCLIPICCLLVTRVHSPAAALGLLMGMMFGHSLWGNITLPAEVFPKRAVGSVSGFGGAMGGLAGAVTQLTIGWVVQRFSFTPIFAACSGAYLLGFLLVHFLIGELGYIREMGPGAARNSRQ
jgi:ACS family hexuronate transporter-like MFS transporter